MRAAFATPVFAAVLGLAACFAPATANQPSTASGAAEVGEVVQIYYWKAKPGKFDEYSRYVREVAEPIDHEAQRRGAFVSVTTYVVRDTLNPWTHMRVFVLRDSAQLRRLSTELDSAGMRLEPDSAKRRMRGEYSATLRDRVGAATGGILR
jgi:hypothetical protein